MARLNDKTAGAIVPAALAALMIASIFVIAGCGGVEEAVIIGTEPLDRVSKVEDELIALETWVESRQKGDILVHVDAIDDIEIVPQALEESMKNAADHLKHGNTGVIYDIASFLETSGTLGLGRRAGLYDSVVWIFPSRRPVAELGLDSIKRFLIKARGYKPDDLSALAVSGNWIVGTLGGVPVTITNMEDFDPGEATAIVDIDLSYFSGMEAQNPEYRIGTAALLDFLHAMKEKEIRGRLVTVTLSGKERVVPVSTRFMGDIIVESLRDPETLVYQPEKWKTMTDAEALLAEERFLAAESLYSRLVEEYPEDAGLQYMRGATLALLGWGRECAAHLTRAYRIDKLYLSGFFQVANFVAKRGQLDVAERIVNDPVLRQAYRRSELNYRTGIMYVGAGRPEKALPLFASVAEIEGPTVDIALLIFRTARDAGDEAEMLSSLETLVRIDKSLVRDRMPWVYRELGILYEKRGEDGKAGKAYSLYIEAAPEDSAAVELKKVFEGKKSLNP